MSWLDDEGHLAPPWTVNAAADMMYGLMSFDLLERMCEDRRWSRKRYGETLVLVFRTTFTGGTEDVAKVAESIHWLDVSRRDQCRRDHLDQRNRHPTFDSAQQSSNTPVPPGRCRCGLGARGPN